LCIRGLEVRGGVPVMVAASPLIAIPCFSFLYDQNKKLLKSSS